MDKNVNENFDQGEFIATGDNNRISAAVVYTDQAFLKRRVRVNAQEALNRFLIEIQAYMVDVDSTLASVYGEGEIFSVQYREIPVKHAPQEGIRELESKKELLEGQRQALRNEKEVGDKQVRFLDSMISFAEADLPKRVKTQFPTTESLSTMLEFLAENFQKLAHKDIELQHQIKDLDREIVVVEKRLKKFQRPKARTLKVIEVVFDSPKEQSLIIEVSYVAQSASWEPVYKVDVPLDLAGVGLTMFARIRQNTGENWQDIKLAVSNAIPLKGASLPDMQSWNLSLPAEEMLLAGAPVAIEEGAAMSKKASKRRSQMVAEEILEDGADLLAVAELASEAEFQQAEQKELPLAFEYELPQGIIINSGGGETMLPLFTKKMKGNFFIHTVPQNDPLAYLACRIAPDSALLAGRLNVHFGGRFVGGTAFSEKKAGEDLLINLGAERGVKVRRELITDKLTETFFGRVERSMVGRELQYRIQVENLKDEVVGLELFDSIPVSKTDRIQIKGIELIPDPAVKDFKDREGVMKWKVQLKPKSVQEIRVKFFVKHPKDRRPQGL
jgi:uncharacterized protein (TIGR02231 family)